MALTVGTVRLNIGCGEYRMRAAGWVNVDEMKESAADLVLHVPPLPWETESVAEIYAGHFFEHLDHAEGADFLDECYRVLQPMGKLGLMVPDTREVMRRYILNEPAPMEFPAGSHRDLRDLDACCSMLLFSTDQPSRHRWAYDKFTLTRAMKRAGFTDIVEFDRFNDPRVAVGAWYQFGLDCTKE